MLYSSLNMQRFRFASGFTVLEILVVVLIVGILGSVAVYGLNISRAMSRDVKRISDVSVIRAALTQYWLRNASYPQSEPVDLGRPGASILPLSLERIPVGPKSNEYYRYHGSSKGYSLRFITERQSEYGPAGIWYAHTQGVDTEDVEK